MLSRKTFLRTGLFVTIVQKIESHTDVFDIFPDKKWSYVECICICLHVHETHPEILNQMVTSDCRIKAKCQQSDRYADWGLSCSLMRINKSSMCQKLQFSSLLTADYFPLIIVLIRQLQTRQTRQFILHMKFLFKFL